MIIKYKKSILSKGGMLFCVFHLAKRRKSLIENKGKGAKPEFQKNFRYFSVSIEEVCGKL